MRIHPGLPLPPALARPVAAQATEPEPVREHPWAAGLSDSARKALRGLPLEGDQDARVRKAMTELLRQRASTEEDRLTFLEARLQEVTGRARAYCVGQLLTTAAHSSWQPHRDRFPEARAWQEIEQLSAHPECAALGTLAHQWTADVELSDSRRAILRVLLHDPPRQDTPAERRRLLDVLDRTMTEGGPRNDRMRLLPRELERLRATGARDEETALAVAQVGASLAVNWDKSGLPAVSYLSDYPATAEAGRLADHWLARATDGNARQAIAVCTLRSPRAERNSLARVIHDQMRHWAPVEARVAFLHHEVADESRLPALGQLGVHLAQEGVEHLAPLLDKLRATPEGRPAVELAERWASLIAPERKRWVYQVILPEVGSLLDEKRLGDRLLGALRDSPAEEYEAVRAFLDSRTQVQRLAAPQPAQTVEETSASVLVGGVRVGKRRVRESSAAAEPADRTPARPAPGDRGDAPTSPT